MQRVHLVPRLGRQADGQAHHRRRRGDERRAARSAACAEDGAHDHSTSSHAVCEHAIDRGWASDNPVRRAARPKRRRGGDVDPDLHFLSLEELEAVIRAIPDEVVVPRAGAVPPRPARARRRPRRPTSSGPVLRVLIRTAAMTGLRQLRARSACAGATSTGPPSASACATPTCAASTRPPASPTSRPAARCRWPTAWSASSTRWSRRTNCDRRRSTSSSPTRTPAGRSTAPRSPSASSRPAATPACPVIRFHDLRHTFATRLAATGTAAASDPGVPRPRRREDHADLRALRAVARTRSRWSTRRSRASRR